MACSSIRPPPGIRHNVESFASTGTRNTVRRNCVWGAARAGAPAPSGIQSPQVGFTAHDNLVADPRYMDRADGDFRLRDESPCRAVLGDVAPGPREEGTDDGPGVEPPEDSEPCEVSPQALQGLASVEAFDDGSTGAPETSEDAGDEDSEDSGADQDAGGGDSEDGEGVGDEEPVQGSQAEDVDAPADASRPVTSLGDSCAQAPEETGGSVGGPGGTAGGGDGGSPGSGGTSGSGSTDPSGGSDGGSSGGGGGGGAGASETTAAVGPIPHIASPPATPTTLSGDPVKRRVGRCARFRQRTTATRALQRRARRSCRRSSRQTTARGRGSAARR